MCNYVNTFVTVFHRILDFKRGWISILALFLFIPAKPINY